MDMSGLEWTPDVSIYRQPWRESTGACLQAPAGEGITMTGRTPEQDQAVADFLQDLYDATEGKGAHEGHTLEQVGRCVYCSCGLRWQGTLPEGSR